MTDDEERIADGERRLAGRREKDVERLPRLGLIRVFLSLLVGFMAGLVGWTVVLMLILLRQGPSVTAQLPALPPALHVIAFGLPGLAAGYWIFTTLGSPHS